MSDVIEIRVPDIGDFEGVEVVELLVGPGDEVAVDDGLISIESEKATMEIPSPAAGIVQSFHVALGDAVSEGTLIAEVAVSDASPVAASEEVASGSEEPETSGSPVSIEGLEGVEPKPPEGREGAAESEGRVPGEGPHREPPVPDRGRPGRGQAGDGARGRWAAVQPRRGGERA